MRDKQEYLWRDHLLTKKQLKQILSEEEYRDFFGLKGSKYYEKKHTRIR